MVSKAILKKRSSDHLLVYILNIEPNFYSTKSAAERKTNHRIWWPNDFDSLPRKRWRITRCCSCQMFWKCTWRTGRLNHLNSTATHPLRWVQERTLPCSQMRLHNLDCFKYWMLLRDVRYEVRSQFLLISSIYISIHIYIYTFVFSFFSFLFYFELVLIAAHHSSFAFLIVEIIYWHSCRAFAISTAH